MDTRLLVRSDESDAVIGLIVPSNNVVIESEFAAGCPAGIDVVATRVPNVRDEVADLEAMVAHVDAAARLLADARPGVVALACTSASALHGADWERQLRARVGAAAGVSGVTTAGAIADALHALDAHRVAVATPYPPAIDRRIVRFLSDHEIDVVDIAGLGIVEGRDASRCAPEVIERLVCGLALDTADSIFVSCTNLPTRDVADRLSTLTGLPVVTSNGATRTACLAALGIAADPRPSADTPIPSRRTA